MQIVRTHSPARVGLFGNPSDGYYGKTVAAAFSKYRAQVVLYEWPTLEVVSSRDDRAGFSSVRELVEDVEQHGYYGGIRLVKATIKRFAEYCEAQRLTLHARNFSIRYETNIPRQVGLAGSSAIVVATLRALMQFYGVSILPDVQPSLALSVERDELGITAGLQDRVAQCLEGVVAMDFARDRRRVLHGFECGRYTRLDPQLLPPVYVAFDRRRSEPTEVLHRPLKVRYDDGDRDVHEAMARLADLTDEAVEALESGARFRLHELMDENFDIRARICPISPRHREMIDVARATGASAKFAGSGGAIVGLFEDAKMLADLRRNLGSIGCQVDVLRVAGRDIKLDQQDSAPTNSATASTPSEI